MVNEGGTVEQTAPLTHLMMGDLKGILELFRESGLHSVRTTVKDEMEKRLESNASAYPCSSLVVDSK